MNELIQLNQINIPNAIHEGIKLLFFDILNETKASYGTYLIRHPPDKEWIIPEIFMEGGESKIVNHSLYLKISGQNIDRYKMLKTVQSLLNSDLTDKDIYYHLIPSSLLHPNVQIILVFVQSLKVIPHEKYIPLLCLQFMKQYIEQTINESSIVRVISKLKTPLNEIINYSAKPDVVKKSSISIAVIVNDLIDLYKLKRNKLKLAYNIVNIRQFMEELSNIINFEYALDEDVPENIFTDSKRLKQICLNFLNNNSKVYISSTIAVSDDEHNSFNISFDIENAEILYDERLYITKKLIALLGGTVIMDPLQFVIEAFVDSVSHSNRTLKKIKNKKILIVDHNEERRFDIGNRLKSWELDISFAATDHEGSILLNTQYNLYIVGNSSFNDKLHRLGIGPVMFFSDNSTTPESSPRLRISTITKPLKYPIDDETLLSTIFELLN